MQVDSGAKMTGTAWWMAPELVPGGKLSDAASEKSDVWYVESVPSLLPLFTIHTTSESHSTAVGPFFVVHFHDEVP